jgi:hypothetical protein
MSKLLNKQNISIVVDTYIDKNTGQEKKSYRTVGELITMQGNDGPYQFGKLWGPGGVVEFKIYDQKERDSAMQAAGLSSPTASPIGQAPAATPPARGFDDDIPF